MDSFENIVAHLLQRQGYWVQTSFKVDLTKEEKIRIGRPSSPRWELDVIAYKGAGNQLMVVECKSYLDSPGVRIRGFDPSDKTYGKLFKLFNNQVLRDTVLKRLAIQLAESGACAEEPDVVLALAAGRFATEADRVAVRCHFEENGWELFDDKWLCEQLIEMSKGSYENETDAVVSKILLRNQSIVEQILHD